MSWREATGDMIIVRYADDFIVGFQHEACARRFLDTMRERLQEFALSLHPEKTRLIEFGRLAMENRKRRALCRHPPKVGAVCPNWARTVLCGGREVTRVPTAIMRQRLPK